MEPEQAEGMARALGEELGEHMAVKGDLQSGFQQVRSDPRAEIRQVRTDLGAEIQQLRTDLSADIQAVDHKVDLCRARIDAVDGKIDSVHSTLKLLSTGVGLALAFLAPAASAPTPNASPGSPAATAS